MCFEMRKPMRWRVAVGVTVVALFASCTLADLTNGGFETGNLTGWTWTKDKGSTVTVVTGHSTWDPSEGSYFAQLKSDGNSGFVQLFQSFTASAQDNILKGDYFWDGATGNQVSAVGKILGPTGNQIGLPLFTFSQADVDTGWLSFSRSLTPGQTYTLWFELRNVTLGNGNCYLGIDNAQLVPLPAAVLLGVLGLAAAGLKLRKLV